MADAKKRTGSAAIKASMEGTAAIKKLLAPTDGGSKKRAKVVRGGTNTIAVQGQPVDVKVEKEQSFTDLIAQGETMYEDLKKTMEAQKGDSLRRVATASLPPSSSSSSSFPFSSTPTGCAKTCGNCQAQSLKSDCWKCGFPL